MSLLEDMAKESVMSGFPVITDNMKNNIQYNGSEEKLGVCFNGINYMLKKQKNDWNNVMSEHVASSIINVLGGNAHKTMMALYGGNLVVLCKDFTDEYKDIHSMYDVSESSIDTDANTHEYFYDDVIYVMSKVRDLDIVRFEEDFLKMYVFDSILGNTDRHNGNWSIAKLNGVKCMTPIFDNGASLFPRANPEDMSMNWIEERIKVFPNSKIMFGKERKRSSYYETWINRLLPDYAYDYANSLDINKAIDFIYSENITDDWKRLYSTMVYNRYMFFVKGVNNIESY